MSNKMWKGQVTSDFADEIGEIQEINLLFLYQESFWLKIPVYRPFLYMCNFN